MKKIIIFSIFIAAACGIYAFSTSKIAITNADVATTTKSMTEGSIVWHTWSEAEALNKKNPRKIIVDVFTDWCGWCKVMDRETFPNKDITKYINEKFYAVKLNAEQREDIMFDGKKFSFVANGRSGFHTLAASLLDNQMSYPTIVYLNEKYERIIISPGFKKPEDLIKELKFTAEEQYTKVSFDEYRSKSK